MKGVKRIMIKRLIGFLIVASLIVSAGSAFAAELNIGTRLYTKFLDRNTYDPSLYRTTGNGVGIRSELELTLDGKISDRAELGGRILSVWDPPGNAHYSDWHGWYDGGANLMQLRGVWLKFYPATIPQIKSVRIGTSDLGMFSPWTVGKIRWIDRDNARMILVEGESDKVNYNAGAVPLPSFMGPNWNTGPNPRRGWAFAGGFSYAPSKVLNLKFSGSRVMALQQDPTTTDDTKAVKRFDNVVGVFDALYTPSPILNVSGLAGFSRHTANLGLIGAPQGWWPARFDSATGLAFQLRGIASDPFGIGLTLKGEVFDVDPDFVSIMAARRETNVLLSEGHVRYGANVNGSTWKGDVGFTPSGHVDNNFTDWNEAQYYNIIGTNGITFIPEFRSGPLGIKGEVSYGSNKLNSQNVDTAKYVGSAPRVDESSYLVAARGDYLIPFGTGLGVFGKVKMTNWKDGVNKNIGTDDVAMEDTEIYAGASYQLTDEIGLTGGYKLLNYLSKGNGTSASAKTYELQAGMIFAEVKANVGGVDMALFVEKVDGEDKVTSADVNDMRLKGTVEVKI
jgi:hypothetical protein